MTFAAYLIGAGLSAGLLFHVWRKARPDEDDEVFMALMASISAIWWPITLLAVATVIALRKVDAIRKKLKDAEQ